MCIIDYFFGEVMSECSNSFLCNKNFAADGAMFTFSKTSFGARGSNCRVDFFNMFTRFSIRQMNGHCGTDTPARVGNVWSVSFVSAVAVGVYIKCRCDYRGIVNTGCGAKTPYVSGCHACVQSQSPITFIQSL